MKQEAINLANKVLHDLNFGKHRSTTQIIAEALEEYAQQQVKRQLLDICIDNRQIREGIQKICSKVLTMNVQSTGDYGMGGECPFCKKRLQMGCFIG